MADAIYRDDAVFIPGRGGVMIAPVGTLPPTAAALQSWVDAGATGPLGDFVPLGYTSSEELPSIDTDTDGGEVKGSWENSALRTTKTTVTESITVTPIQWTKAPLTHRFGPGTIDDTKGHFHTPAVYSATEVAMLVIIIDGTSALGIEYYKVASSPEGGIELDSEDFAGLPVKWTVLTAAVKDGGGTVMRRMTVVESALMKASTGGEG
ncbi:phage tail tube protein [Corynebacterium variabile]|uniref:phage tail tube protein n=1 Tax=Corynebacterium variabile TaxID=1727 RepID=UPI003FD5E41A